MEIFIQFEELIVLLEGLLCHSEFHDFMNAGKIICVLSLMKNPRYDFSHHDVTLLLNIKIVCHHFLPAYTQTVWGI